MVTGEVAKHAHPGLIHNQENSNTALLVASIQIDKVLYT
jgi:hypothetical protein